MNRRDFFHRCGLRAAQTSLLFCFLGMRFIPYASGNCAGWAGTVHWFGRLVAFVPADGGKWLFWLGR